MSTYNPEKFKMNANDYLSNYYNDHKSRMISLALSNPTLFYDVKSNVISILKRDLVEKFYDTIFEVLSKGTVNTIDIYKGLISISKYPIKYPSHLINEKALSFASSIDEMLDDIVNIIMPEKIDAIVTNTLAKVGDRSIGKE